MNEKQKFSNVIIEDSVLGCLILNSKKTNYLLPKIKDEYFFGDDNAEVFKSIINLQKNGKPVDLISVSREAGIKGSLLAKKIQNSSSISSMQNHINYLKEFSDLRWFTSKMKETESELTPKKALSKMIELSSKIISRNRDNKTEETGSESLIDEFEKYQEVNRNHIESGAEFIGTPCGYKQIDEKISGIRGQHYWIVTAYTNTGKSYFLLNVANHLLEQGKRVLFFSLEMSKNQNIARLIGIKTIVDPTEIEKGISSGDRLDDEVRAKAEIYESKLEIFNQIKNIEDILITIYSEHSKEPVDLIIIDYIQKIQSTEKSSRYDRITTASDSIQKICQELSIPAIVASQIDNEAAKSNNRDIISTKGSGDVGADADFSLRLSKTDVPNEVECLIQKNRHGQKGGCVLKFCDGGKLIEI